MSIEDASRCVEGSIELYIELYIEDVEARTHKFLEGLLRGLCAGCAGAQRPSRLPHSSS